MTSKNEVLDSIYNLNGEPGKCVSAYKDWAVTYDADTLEGMNYVGPRVAGAGPRLRHGGRRR
jgi:hypothetical protein